MCVLKEAELNQTVREMFKCSFTEECVHHTNLTFWTNHPSVAEAGQFLKAKFSAYAPGCWRQKHFNQSRNDWNALQWVSSRQNAVASQKAVNGTKNINLMSNNITSCFFNWDTIVKGRWLFNTLDQYSDIVFEFTKFMIYGSVR